MLGLSIEDAIKKFDACEHRGKCNAFNKENPGLICSNAWTCSLIRHYQEPIKKERITFKIGQEITVTKTHDIKGLIDEEETIRIKEGDKAYIKAIGAIEYLTGDARGKMQFLSEDIFEIKGYDHENIASMVYDRLSYRFQMEAFLEDYDISEKEFKEEIQYILDEIL